MRSASNRTYRYLDSDDDRRELVADMTRVRQTVAQLAESVPENRRYEPRYHGWSVGGMLAHLHHTDNLALWAIQLALVGLRLPVPLPVVDQFNGLTARVFHKRLVETTLRDLRRNHKRLTDFILRLPVNKYSQPVYDVSGQSFVTVERAMQIYFLFHWQEHLLTMQKVEGIFYEPPERYDTL